jgi:hypothetical protein
MNEVDTEPADSSHSLQRDGEPPDPATTVAPSPGKLLKRSEAPRLLGVSTATVRRMEGSTLSPVLGSDGRGAGDDSSTVIFPGSALSKLGAFKCSHAHCATRCVDDVLSVLPPTAMEAAARAAPKAFAAAVRRLARATVRRATP